MRFTFEANMKGKGDCGKCPLCYIVPFQPTYGKLCLLTQKMIALEDFQCPLEESESYENKATSTNAGVEVDYPDNLIVWHPYPEEKPAEKTRVFVQGKDNDIFIDEFVEGEFYWDPYYPVVAWAELPRPYGGKTDDN